MKHRGRLQVQGNDMNPELSRPWAQKVPRLADDAINDLGELEAECTPSQLSKRAQAFLKARRFVNNARGNGVWAPVRWSHSNPRVDKTARVDIEVSLGRAFV